jgi:hypothetical protein
VEDKESFRWLQGADEAASVCIGARRITVVADRESDIYEAFALRPDGVELLVRAAQDRSLKTAASCSKRWTPCRKPDAPTWPCRPGLALRPAPRAQTMRRGPRSPLCSDRTLP